MARKRVQLDRTVGPPAARRRPLQTRRPRDYPGVPRCYLDLARRLSSPTLVGPPLCDELMAFLQHLFDEQEASLARHLGLWRARSADDVAAAEGLPVAEVAPVLRAMARDKHAIYSERDTRGGRRYRLLPVMPGIFEMVLMSREPATLTPWHRRFAELFEALYETGYLREYWEKRTAPLLRFIPLQQAVGAHPAALPSDKLEVILDRYDSFAVGHCQCRMTMAVVGESCEKPLENCMALGGWADAAIHRGLMRRVSARTALELKLEAEAHGLVSWMMNIESTPGQASCSCCGCCCHAMRAVNDLDAPSLAAPPHFTPVIDRGRCKACGRCAAACPMHALETERKVETRWIAARCIGCGLCALACKRQAITMTPVPDYRLPPDSWFAFVARGLPAAARGSLRMWWRRSAVASWWRG